jgi:hypothetical protein
MPIPLALTLLSTVGPAVAKYIGAKKAADTLKLDELDPLDLKAQYDQLKESMPEFGVGSAFNEYLAMSKQDPAADMERKIAAQQEASNIGALKAGGAKALLGGLGSASRQAAANRMGIEGRSAQRQQSALSNYAAQQQRVQDANARMRQALEMGQFDAMRDLEKYNIGVNQYNQMLEAQKQQALWGGIGDLAGSATSMYDAFQNVPGKSLTTGADFRAEPGIQIDPNQINPNPVMSDDMLNMGTQATGLPTPTLGSGFGGGMYGLGVPPFSKNGGMITKGAFSHETNPIDIMQDGAKVGEMTGGEAILNPEQQKKVAKQSPYFRKLMREFAMRNRK